MTHAYQSTARPWCRRFGAAVFDAASLGVALSAHGAASDPVLPGEVMVKLLSADALPSLLTRHRLSLVARFGARPIYRLKLVGAGSVDAKVTELSKDPAVAIAEPNVEHSSPEGRKTKVWAIGSASAYAAQWAPQAIRLAQAHKLSKGAGVRVAVLDTGVDRKHPALAGRLLPGHDFVGDDSNPAERGSVGDAGYGHGTHVAGLIAMVAPRARIMPLRVLDADGIGNAWVLQEALLYAVDPDGDPSTDDGAQVINMSLGSLSRTRLFDAISLLVSCSTPDAVDPAVDFSDPGYNEDKQRCARSKGAVVVAAAGNSASKKLREYPAAEGAYGVLSVGASRSGRRLASFSNFGSWVDLAAPGDRITSSVPKGLYGTWSGTSMAAPMVAGTAALLRSAKPSLSAKDLARRIERTTSTLCGTSLQQLDAAAALTNVPAPEVDCP